MVSVLQRSLAQPTNRQKREVAQAIAALSIGGMVVARTMVDRAAADDLRAACTNMALQLGGWDRAAQRKSAQTR
jgi:hypothetical protein